MSKKSDDGNNLKVIEWRGDNEKILKSWADKAQCYQIMHDRAHKRYWCLNAWFSIPVIIFSTVTGTGNFAQDSVSDSWKYQLIYIIGTLNLVSAIITTISQFLGVAQKSESHRLASILWDKFCRKIRIELSKVRKERVPCNVFLTTCQQEYDRLIETSPSMPTDIVRWFKKLVNGKSEDDVGGCKLCIYECFCFPFGIECCNSSKCCCTNPCTSKKDCGRDNDLVGLDMPEIVGKLKETQINTEDEGNKQNEYEIYDNNP